MVARSRNGTTKAFPVVETIHKDSICHTTETPAQVPAETALRAQQVAEQAVACLEGRLLDPFKSVADKHAAASYAHQNLASAVVWRRLTAPVCTQLGPDPKYVPSWDLTPSMYPAGT